MQKIISLNILEPTVRKRTELSKLYEEYLACSKELFAIWKENKGITQTALHHLTYKSFRKKYKLSADLLISARTSIWNRRKVCDKIDSIPIRFNSKLFRIDTNKGRTLVICLAGYTKYKRIALPIAKDGAYQRLQDYLKQSYVISSVLLFKDFRVQILIKKEFEEPSESKNVIGIDTNANCFAVSVYNTKKQKVLRQLYFGQDLAIRKRNFERRKDKLKSLADLGSQKAFKSLRRLKYKEANFIKTRCWQVAHQVIKLSKSYGNASIIVEDLYKLRTGRKFGNSKGKKSNRKINKIPYAKFFHALSVLCEQNIIGFHKVNPAYTSQLCSRCRALNKITTNYRTYKCKSCGLVMNRDRNASVNICKLFRERSIVTNTFQPSLNRMPVNASLLSNATCNS